MNRFKLPARLAASGLVLVTFMISAGLSLAQAQPVPHPVSTRQAAPATKALVTPVETDKVCMVNNQYFGTPQIPVEVDGRTYYGCCEGCKATLAGDPKARTAVDPVSGKPVDKAVAYIGAYPDGRVLYFGNAANLKAWNQR